MVVNIGVSRDQSDTAQLHAAITPPSRVQLSIVVLLGCSTNYQASIDVDKNTCYLSASGENRNRT